MKPRRSQSHIPNCASCCSKSSAADMQWKILDMCVRGCSIVRQCVLIMRMSVVWRWEPFDARWTFRHKVQGRLLPPRAVHVEVDMGRSFSVFLFCLAMDPIYHYLNRIPRVMSVQGYIFFWSNALIALARSLCKCFLAELITVGEADV